MYPQVLFQNRKPNRIATMEEYRQSGGYSTLENALKNRTCKDIQQLVLEADLRGRGGAGFPAGKKLMAVADDAPFPRYVICNADEMEPGTFKDRILIHADPHMIIEGMIFAGYAELAEEGFFFIRPEYESGAKILEREIGIAREAGYLGKNILGSTFSFDITVHRSAGRYICGEVTALVHALEGKRPNPKRPPPYPTDKGLWGQPTVIYNVETIACIPHVVRNGVEWFRGLAKTEGGAGTKVYCVSGKVNRPGAYELPIGTTLREIVEEHAGGMTEGSQFKACLPGGASTRFLPRDYYDIAMDFDPLQKAGNRLGTGAIMVFDQKTCLLAVTLNLTRFFARESCGFCTPCREGLPYIEELLHRIERGEGEPEFIPMIRSMATEMFNAYCAFALGAASPIESLLAYYEEEVLEHIERKACPFAEWRT